MSLVKKHFSLLLAVLLGVSAGPALGQVEIELVALSLQSSSDMLSTLPASEPNFPLGSSIFLEMWARTTDANGLAFAAADVSYAPAAVSVVSITHTALFSGFPAGTDNGAGFIDNLGGAVPVTVPACGTMAGVTPNWGRVAVVEFSTNAEGVAFFSGADSNDFIFVVANCGNLTAPIVTYGGVSTTICASSDTTCDGIDDDCNGLVDDGFVGVATSCGVGPCASTGSTECINGSLVDTCTAGVPAIDDVTCDGIDDNCNGFIDDGYVSVTTTCGSGPCAAFGSTSCVNGVVLDDCMAGTGAANDATCDGVDDDCDGLIDEDFVSVATACGLGACASTGITSCTGGVEADSCVAGTPAGSDAICDGIDDDCNGLVDDGFVSQTTACGVGACSSTGITSCNAGAESDSCVSGTPAIGDATCDDIDDDCDGFVDEDFVSVSTTCGAGPCASTGSTSCIVGVVVDSCSAGTGAINDATCDGVDDDCDGLIDEDFVSLATFCGLGACFSTGVDFCVNGVLLDSCVPGTPAGNDTTCDGIDDDCNGINDDGFVSQVTACGTGACASSGNTSCVGGAIQDSCTAGTPAAGDTTCDGIDDNCNGVADEGFAPTFTSCGIGACISNGSTSCVSGTLADSCTPGTPAADDATCDGIDDDCNGVADDGFVATGTACGMGACAAVGSLDCINGALIDSCTPGTPTGPGSGCNGVVDIELVALSLTGASDVAGALPLSESDFTVGSTFFVEVWAQTNVPEGLAQVSVDVSFDPVFLSATSITQTALFNLFPDGVIDNGIGLIDNLSGSHLSAACVDQVGFGSWARVAIIEMLAGAEGTNNITVQSADSNDFIFVVSACGHVDPPFVNYGGVVLSLCTLVDTTCDNFDDDCDGFVDDDYLSLPTACGIGACSSTGSTSCVNGAVVDSCSAGTGLANDATCDGVDDDCDGLVDEDYASVGTTCGTGACSSTGSTSCVNGAVVDSCSAGTGSANDATCDGVDDDCDGLVDEDFVSTQTACGTGACSSVGSTSCVSGVEEDSCTVGTPALDDSVCDGVDNDCDGVTDEDFVSVRKSCGVGACESTGFTQCVSGAVVSDCVPGSPAANDPTCDGVDDDCDGLADEDFASTATTCGVGACESAGATSCVGGIVEDSCAAGSPTAEVCDGVDNDCDGVVDQDPAASDSCPPGEVCNSGVCGTGPGTNLPCGDLDGDTFVTFGDYSIFFAAYGSSVGDANYNGAADMDDDGIVALNDFAAWYQCWLTFVNGG